MIIKRQKESPGNHNYQWTKNDRKQLKVMLKEGKTTKEIADALGRTPAAVLYQKSSMGLATTKKVKEKKVKMKTKEGKKIEVKVSSEVLPADSDKSPVDKAKEMASVARGIARSNGKRITMAMFFVEDL
jgi:hypothetical protein